MCDSLVQQDLLGIDAEQMSDDDIDQRARVCTAETLRSNEPRLYAAAARLFYEFGFSQKRIACVCRISRATVSAIVAACDGGVAAESMRMASLRRVRRIGLLAIDRVEELLRDDAQVKKAGIAVMVDVATMLDSLAGSIFEKGAPTMSVDSQAIPENSNCDKYLEQ